jgi:hypothetical protein
MLTRALLLPVALSTVLAVAIPALAQPFNEQNHEHPHGAPAAEGAHPGAHPGAPSGVHPAAPPPSGPRPPGPAAFRGGPDPHFAGGPERFHPSPEAWHHGEWRHEWHDGRFGWWWSVGPTWYFFDEPVYPYPAYAAPVVVAPPPVVVQAPPPPVTGAPPSQFWYFCNSPQGYYPQVPNCNGPWQEVPATPSQ